MIKTERKEIPPKGESYVLNATEISELLYGIPQYDQLSIIFQFSNTEYYRNAKRKVHANEVTVLRISYMKRGGVFSTQGELRNGTLSTASWSIWQNAISSKFRQSVKSVIFNKIQEEIRRLCHDSNAIELCQRRTIEVAVNFSNETVILKDTQDKKEQIIKQYRIAEPNV